MKIATGLFNRLTLVRALLISVVFLGFAVVGIGLF
jgi:hypothetical protein